jgi:dynein heavy chain
MNEHIRKKIKEYNMYRVQIPEDGQVYDYKFIADENIWELWTEQAKNFQVDAKKSFTKAVIPTNDNIRMHYLMKVLLCRMNYHVLCPGPTGTGKTVNAMKLLTSDLPDTHQYITLTFSA